MKKPLLKIIVFCFLAAALIILTGCKGETASPPPPEGPSAQQQTSAATSEAVKESPTGSGDSSPSASADPAAIEIEWQNSPHADTFVTDEQNQNNTCARCHAPNNWAPTMEELPESCFACKFELEEPAPLIDQSAWTNVSCNVCHKVDKKGKVAPEYAWLEVAPLSEYAEVGSPSELCLKCHAPVDVPHHGSVMIGGAHAGYQCTQCHSAHSTTASCGSVGCHNSESITGHDAFHQDVTCVACHDGSGMDVDRDEITGLWSTYIQDAAGNPSGKFSFTSHNIALEVNCTRCHFSDNPWGLSDEPDTQ